MNSKSLKRTLSAGLCAVAVASAAAAAPEEMPDWAVEVIQVKNGSKPLDAGAKDTGPQGRWFEQEEKGHAAPIFHDWDGDGLKDLIVGGFAGRFRVFKNIGTADTPAFDGYEWLEAGSEVAHIRNFCCVAAGPRMVDINDDGIDDLVAGTYSPGSSTGSKAARMASSPGRCSRIGMVSRWSRASRTYRTLLISPMAPSRLDGLGRRW